MSKMLSAITKVPVTPEQIRRAVDAAENSRANGEDAPPEIIIIREFAGDDLGHMTIPAIMFRMIALSEIIQARNAEKWVIEVDGTHHVLVPDALLIATAKCPLRHRKTNDRFAFDTQELLAIALAESDVEGTG